MKFSNLLSIINLTAIGDLGAVSLKYGWLLNVITWFIGLVADVGVGIMLFTLALKLITLPLDIFSRASMKKNSLKMEMMRDDLEKLQKQYANNKQLYQQKMMALYKKNGYSAFSACLPTIVTLVFFIVVIGAFNSYSKKTDFDVFVEMGSAYDAVIEGISCDESGDYTNSPVIKTEKGNYVINVEYVLNQKEYSSYFTYNGGRVYETVSYAIDVDSLSVDIKEKFAINEFFKNGGYDYSNEDIVRIYREYSVDEYIRNKSLDEKYYDASNKENSAVWKNENGKYYFYNVSAISVADVDNEYVENGKFSIEKFYSDYSNDVIKEKSANDAVTERALETVCKEYKEENVLKQARDVAADTYEEKRSKSVVFFWVKNLWVVDSPFSSAIPEYSKLSSTLYGKSGSPTFTQEKYNELTYELGKYKQTGFGKGNGYFILVALSILTMLASTLIMNKTQKTQMELSSVDGANGQAAMQQKMMTWMMPIMFGIFAFIYSAGFSIYMVTSSILSTVFTLLINLCVEKSFKKKIEKEFAEKNQKPRYGKRR